MSEIVDFWERNAKGEIVPLTKQVILENIAFKSEIKNYENKLIDASPDDFDKIKQVIEELEKASKEYEQVIDVTFTPLLNYEIKTLTNEKLGCNGMPVDDQSADICANHCLVPKWTYEQWRDTKDARLKNRVVKLIFTNSFPELPKQDEIKKKILTIINTPYK